MSKIIETLRPEEIEKRSFEIIEKELLAQNMIIEDESLKPIIKRVIHTTADFDYFHTLCFSNGAVEGALKAIAEGAVFITDTNMGKSGINKRALSNLGCEVSCYMADSEVADIAKERGITRASVSMEKAATLNQKTIFAIGNAPTALITLYNLIKEGKLRPELIIGVPVGFVNVVEAKEMIMELDIPYIVAKGRKGGSNVAACICNALLYMAERKY